MNSLLLVCLCSNVILCFLENLGFLFRVAGFRVGNTVAGYSLQSSLGFISRVFSFFLIPVISWMADSKLIAIDLRLIMIYYILLFIAIFSCIKIEDEIVSILSKVISNVQKQGSLSISSPRQLFRCLASILSCIKLLVKRILTNTKSSKSYNSLLGRSDRFNTDLFSLTYISYYAAWIIVCILLTRFPDKPAFCISMVTFFTFLSTLAQSLIFDPYASSTALDFDKSIAIYQRLQLKKLHSVCLSCILSVLLYSMVRLSASFSF